MCSQSAMVAARVVNVWSLILCDVSVDGIVTHPRRDDRDYAGDYEPVLGMHDVVYTLDLKADTEELVHKKFGVGALRSGATVRAHKQTSVSIHMAL
jgi:hypothetical protein